MHSDWLRGVWSTIGYHLRHIDTSSPPFFAGRKSEQNPLARVKIARREGGDTRREKVKNARSIVPDENEELLVVYQWYEELEFLAQVSLSERVRIS